MNTLDSIHDEVYCRHGSDGVLASYRFRKIKGRWHVSAECIDTNGIWILVFEKDGGASWKEVADLALRLRAAIRTHEARKAAGVM